MEVDDLSPEVVTWGLATQFVGQRIVYHPVLTSTMDVARQEARQGAAEGTVVLADRQTAGRGRMERVWLTPGGNIALSLILYPPLSYLPYLIMLASLAVVHGIETTTGLKPQIKWPNDVLINGKKVCGILIESDVQGGSVSYSIIGIGLNVNLDPADFPEISPIATSLSHELGEDISRLKVLRCLLTELEGLYLRLSDAGSVFREWHDNLETLGREIEVQSGDTFYRGLAESVEVDGSLLLRGADGSLSRIVAGDVTLRR
ncbi:MAG: biotin--[acetyl-CoA-carboxylase] ligase [Dehalococcoidales bacterium]|nr:MAG: biotin--[acetyl-CoA-carboxylase] ligase [Dehalococcoidales bacterium]